MNKKLNKGQASLEVLLILGVVILGAVIAGVYYIGSLGKQIDKSSGLSDLNIGLDDPYSYPGGPGTGGGPVIPTWYYFNEQGEYLENSGNEYSLSGDYVNIPLSVFGDTNSDQVYIDVDNYQVQKQAGPSWQNTSDCSIPNMGDGRLDTEHDSPGKTGYKRPLTINCREIGNYRVFSTLEGQGGDYYDPNTGDLIDPPEWVPEPIHWEFEVVEPQHNFEVSFKPENFQLATTTTPANIELNNINMLDNNTYFAYVQSTSHTTLTRVSDDYVIQENPLEPIPGYFGPFEFSQEINFKLYSSAEGDLDLTFLIYDLEDNFETIYKEYSFVGLPDDKTISFEIVDIDGSPYYGIEEPSNFEENKNTLNTFYFDEIGSSQGVTLSYLNQLQNLFVTNNESFKVVPLLNEGKLPETINQGQNPSFSPMINTFYFDGGGNNFGVQEHCKIKGSTTLDNLDMNYYPTDGSWVDCSYFDDENITSEMPVLQFNTNGQRLFKVNVRQRILDGLNILYTRYYNKEIVVNVTNELNGSLRLSHGVDENVLEPPISYAHDFLAVKNKPFYFAPYLINFENTNDLECSWNVEQSQAANPYFSGPDDFYPEYFFGTKTSNCFRIEDFTPTNNNDIIIDVNITDNYSGQEHNIYKTINVAKDLATNFSVAGNMNQTTYVTNSVSVLIDPIITNGFGNYTCEWWKNGSQINTSTSRCESFYHNFTAEVNTLELRVYDYSLPEGSYQSVSKNINVYPDGVIIPDIHIYVVAPFSTTYNEDEYFEESLGDDGMLYHHSYDSNYSQDSLIELQSDEYTHPNQQLKINSFPIFNFSSGHVPEDDEYTCTWKVNGVSKTEWNNSDNPCQGPFYLETDEYPFDNMIQDPYISDSYYYEITQTITYLAPNTQLEQTKYARILAPFNVALTTFRWSITDLKDIYMSYSNATENYFNVFYKSAWGPRGMSNWACVAFLDSSNLSLRGFKNLLFLDEGSSDSFFYFFDYYYLRSLDEYPQYGDPNYYFYLPFNHSPDGNDYYYLDYPETLLYGKDNLLFNPDTNEFYKEPTGNALYLPISIFTQSEEATANFNLSINNGSGDYTCEYKMHLCEEGDLSCNTYLDTRDLTDFDSYKSFNYNYNILGLNYPSEDWFTSTYFPTFYTDVTDIEDNYIHTGYFETNCHSIYDVLISDALTFTPNQNPDPDWDIENGSLNLRALEIIVTDNQTNKVVNDRIVLAPYKSGVVLPGGWGGNTSACFNKNTKVNTPSGQINIQDIKPGDVVYSYDEENKNIVESKVLNLWVHPKTRNDYLSNKSVKLVLSDSSNLSTVDNTIEVTDNHAFYDPVNKKYKQLKYFSTGDVLLHYDIKTNAFKQVYIKDIIQNLVPYDTVYNLHIEDTHNYFANNVLVHNELKYGSQASIYAQYLAFMATLRMPMKSHSTSSGFTTSFIMYGNSNSTTPENSTITTPDTYEYTTYTYTYLGYDSEMGHVAWDPVLNILVCDPPGCGN